MEEFWVAGEAVRALEVELRRVLPCRRLFSEWEQEATASVARVRVARKEVLLSNRQDASKMKQKRTLTASSSIEREGESSNRRGVLCERERMNLEPV